MKKLILEEWVSLDGYAADKQGELNYFPSTAANRVSDLDQLEFLETIDTILLGRVTYQLFADFWPGATAEKEIIADKLNGIPKAVFSNTLVKAPWGKWPQAQVIRGDAVKEVRARKGGEGKNMVLWGSISLAQSLMRANLIDEYRIQVCPTLVGGGRPLFPGLETYASMRLVRSKTYDTGVICLHYEPENPARP